MLAEFLDWNGVFVKYININNSYTHTKLWYIYWIIIVAYHVNVNVISAFSDATMLMSVWCTVYYMPTRIMLIILASCVISVRSSHQCKFEKLVVKTESSSLVVMTQSFKNLPTYFRWGNNTCSPRLQTPVLNACIFLHKCAKSIHSEKCVRTQRTIRALKTVQRLSAEGWTLRTPNRRHIGDVEEVG